MLRHLCFALLLNTALHADEPAAIPAPDAVLISGPAAVTLGAEARLQLPEGWRFVPRDQLPAYFRGTTTRPGPWDRGVVLDADGRELRLLFEPCGRVNRDGGLASDSLLTRAQVAGNTPARSLLRWQQDPLWEADASVLRLSAVWRNGEDETAALHLRWLGRTGVLKLDWLGPLDQADAAQVGVEALQKSVEWVPGQAHPGDQAPGPVAKLNLDALALDCVVGRTAAVAPAESVPVWAWIAGALAALGALGWGLYKLTLGLMAWLEARRKAQADADRLDKLEKDYGGRAADVEEIED